MCSTIANAPLLVRVDIHPIAIIRTETLEQGALRCRTHDNVECEGKQVVPHRVPKVVKVGLIGEDGLDGLRVRKSHWCKQLSSVHEGMYKMMKEGFEDAVVEPCKAALGQPAYERCNFT